MFVDFLIAYIGPREILSIGFTIKCRVVITKDVIQSLLYMWLYDGWSLILTK